MKLILSILIMLFISGCAGRTLNEDCRDLDGNKIGDFCTGKVVKKL